MTYPEPRTLVHCTTLMPARSTGRARAGLSRSTTAPHKPGSAGPTGSPGARPARASQTFIRDSTYVIVGASHSANGEWRLWAEDAETRDPILEMRCASAQRGHKGAVGGPDQPPLATTTHRGGK